MIQPDERGLMFEYVNNSTSDMLARLEKIAPDKTFLFCHNLAR